MGTKNTDKLTLDSTFDEIERLEPYLENIQDWADCTDDFFSQVRLALNEAVTNAIVHGNHEDSSKKVHIVSILKENTLIISVEDEGPGFDPNKLPNPLDEENLLKESGRGIFLIKQYADEVDFTEKGTKLTMTFSLPDD